MAHEESGTYSKKTTSYFLKRQNYEGMAHKSINYLGLLKFYSI